jgi:hypothetical protein
MCINNLTSTTVQGTTTSELVSLVSLHSYVYSNSPINSCREGAPVVPANAANQVHPTLTEKKQGIGELCSIVVNLQQNMKTRLRKIG